LSNQMAGRPVVLHFRLTSHEMIIDYAARKIGCAADICGGCTARFKEAAPLPTRVERWTLLSSPFKHKKARTQWERRTFKRVVAVECETPEIAKKFLAFSLETLPGEVFAVVTESTLQKVEDFFNPVGYKYLEEEKSSILKTPPPLPFPISIPPRKIFKPQEQKDISTTSS